MGRKSRLFARSLSSLDSRLAGHEAEIAKSLRLHFREYSRFGETFGGDGFDQDCRPTEAVPFGLITF